MPLNKFSPDEITDRLAAYPGWVLGADGQLHTEFEFKDFAQTMLFANAVAHLAQVADHHPDILIHDYKKLALTLSTHSAGGITDRDFRLAEQINALPRLS